MAEGVVAQILNPDLERESGMLLNLSLLQLQITTHFRSEPAIGWIRVKE